MRNFNSPFLVWLIALVALMAVLGVLGIGISLIQRHQLVQAGFVGLAAIGLTMAVFAWANKHAPLR